MEMGVYRHQCSMTTRLIIHVDWYRLSDKTGCTHVHTPSFFIAIKICSGQRIMVQVADGLKMSVTLYDLGRKNV